MKFTRSEVFKMVDDLFHAYASDCRTEAKEDLADIMQRMEDAEAQKRKEENPEGK